MTIDKKHLIDPPKKYRPMPFWSWNTKLEPKETVFQIEEMEKVGMGGFFMHARGGLSTEYMSDEWMENIAAGIDAGEKLGMSPWGYDENGWPSGFGSGEVNGLGAEYQQKYIYMEKTDSVCETPFTVANIKSDDGKNLHFFYETNEFYIDAMDAKVTDAFISSTHEKYKKKLGEKYGKMTGFFTDEPQLSRKEKSIPWSNVMPEEYEKLYGENLLEVLPHLFITSDDCYATRHRYWKLVTKLFSENFVKRIYDWCNENGSLLTGHLVLEENYGAQLDSNGAIMPGYMYFHIPGVDKLCRTVSRDLLAPQLASVAAQTGKKQVLTESFALCGWDVSFEELKWILEWQMVKGANLLCQHLSAYSLEGMRKRDYPAGHSYQNSWWEDYRLFNDFASRVGMLLAEGEIQCDVLVLHTISSGWLDRCDDHNWKKEIDEKYNKPLMDILTYFDKNQILCHLGDETIMEKTGRVEGKSLVIGEMSYKTVVVPTASNFDKNTFDLLKEFYENGGNLIFVGSIPEYISGEKNDCVREIAKTVVDDCEKLCDLIPAESKFINLKDTDGNTADIQYTKRVFDDFSMYYFVNTYSDKKDLVFETQGKSVARFDYMTGEIVPCSFETEKGKIKKNFALEKMGSEVFFVYDDERYKPNTNDKKELKALNPLLSGKWKIESSDPNVLTLDYCDLTIDGKEKHQDIAVIEIHELANSFERETNLRLDFTVKCDSEPKGELYLVVERPEFYDIYINEEKTEKKLCGYFRDKSFSKLDISGLIKKGDNVITLVTNFVQPDYVYDSIRKSKVFESEKNKLCYEREIESIYLLGDFTVKSETPYTNGENHSLLTKGGFVIGSEVSEIDCDRLVEDGFPFFSGKITLSKTLTLTKDEIQNRCIELDRMGAVISKIRVNKKDGGTLVWAPYAFETGDLLKEGENLIEIELTSNFRNILGPHHLGTEAYAVCPGSFFPDSELFQDWDVNRRWTRDYAFLENGIFLKK